MGIFSRIGSLISGTSAATPETDQTSSELHLAQVTTPSTGGGSSSITLPPSISGAVVSQTYQSSAGARISLPPGTRIDQVVVFEGNLFFIQPDGSVVVILDGATQVPTLLVQGAEIPATALAETLQAAGENQIAAGPESAESSGGNFAVPPGQIGPPLDLTPLLPPTALAFAIEINEPIAALDQEGAAAAEDGGPDARDNMDMLLEGRGAMTTGNVIDGVDGDEEQLKDGSPNPSYTEPNEFAPDGPDNEGPNAPAHLTAVEHDGKTYEFGDKDYIEFKTSLGNIIRFEKDGDYKYTNHVDNLIHKKVGITVEFKGESAGFSNTMGYVVLDQNGKPTSGQIMFANSDQNPQDPAFSTMLEGITEKQIAFFLIPNGWTKNESITGFERNAEVVFTQTDDSDPSSPWVANLVADPNNIPLVGQTADAPAYFFVPKGDLTDLNPDDLEHVKDLNGHFGWKIFLANAQVRTAILMILNLTSRSRTNNWILSARPSPTR